MNDQVRKKIEVMKNLFEESKNGKIYLNVLLEKLEALYRLIPSIENAWKEAFFQNWINVESIYAGALSEKREAFTSKESDLIQSFLNIMYESVVQLLQAYTKHPDLTVDKTAQEMERDWLMCPNCIDVWQTSSTDAMVICPKCDSALHNPRYPQAQKK